MEGNQIESLKQGINTGSLSDRIMAMHSLSAIRGRQAYKIIIDYVQDKALGPHAVSALAFARDSRALFPLVNIFSQTNEPAVRQKILQYMYFTGDPRAEEFLTSYLKENSEFRDIAEKALEVCAGNPHFYYRYNGADEKHSAALEAEGQIVVSCKALSNSKKILDEDKTYPFFKPQTYVIPDDRNMYIGGYINEHVKAAKGRDVLAAGEVEFVEKKKGWAVSYINHRSVGYLPAKSCFRWVKEFFKNSDVRFEKEKFDDDFPRDGFNDPDFLSTFRFGANYK